MTDSFFRTFELILTCESYDGDSMEHVIARGDAELHVDCYHDDHGYDPNSGNSITMGLDGQLVVQVGSVDLHLDKKEEPTNSTNMGKVIFVTEGTIEQLIKKMVVEELDEDPTIVGEEE
jgi:hypothetical protein